MTMPDADQALAGENAARFDAGYAVLLVDDEAAFADALAFRLRARDIPARAVYRGEDALAALDRPELEAVLLDVNMPGLHGLEVLRRIKERRPDVEVILVTGEADFAVAARGMRRGAGDYLLKPVDFEVLLTSLDKARRRAREHRERLRAAETVKLMALGALAAGVGHEINNPLQVLVQRSEWLRELAAEAESGAPDIPEMVKSSVVIQEQARRVASITAQLLDLAYQSRTGTAETRLASLAAKVAASFARRAAGSCIDIVVDVHPDVPPVPCSPAELEPVLHHLVRNALDAIDAIEARSPGASGPERVRIRAYPARGGIAIDVEDTGEGVLADNLSRIFEPFFSTRPVGKGTGLGLTVCHSIINALGGRIRCLPLPSGGTRFIVELPLVTTRKIPGSEEITS